MKLSNQNIYNLRGCKKHLGAVPNASGGCKSFLGGAHTPPRTPQKICACLILLPDHSCMQPCSQALTGTPCGGKIRVEAGHVVC